MKAELTGTVSVIIPVYNVSKYLDRCLESVVSQTYPFLEILLIDDGSTDGSGEKCDAWAKRDNRFIVFHKKNEGLGLTRNFGIQHASSDYIIFLDSDDWWENVTVEKMYGAAVANKADIVYMNFYFSSFDKEGNSIDKLFIRHYLFDGVISPKECSEIIFDSDARMWSRIFKKSLFTENNYYMPAHPFEDFPISPLLTLAAERVFQVHEPLYHYYVGRKGSITGKRKNHKYILDGLKELRHSFEEQGYEKQFRTELKEYEFRMCQTALKELDGKEYITPFLEYLKIYVPEKRINTSCKCSVWGSDSLKLLASDFLLSHRQLAEYAQDRCTVDITYCCQDSDYILVDFINDVYRYGESLDIWKKKCDDFISFLKRENLLKKTIIIKFYLASYYGISTKKKSLYKDTDTITQKNNLLEDMYQYFENQLKDNVIFIETKGLDNYTYKYDRQGCKPQNFNQSFRRAVIGKVEKLLNGRKDGE